MCAIGPVSNPIWQSNRHTQLVSPACRHALRCPREVDAYDASHAAVTWRCRPLGVLAASRQTSVLCHLPVEFVTHRGVDLLRRHPLQQAATHAVKRAFVRSPLLHSCNQHMQPGCSADKQGQSHQAAACHHAQVRILDRCCRLRHTEAVQPQRVRQRADHQAATVEMHK